MTVKTIADKLGFGILCGTESLEREISCVYCCDLLSFVMGQAPADSAWVTVMGNVNAAAVALLTDVACVILAKSVNLDDVALKKATDNGIAVLQSSLPVFETALAVHQTLTT